MLCDIYRQLVETSNSPELSLPQAVPPLDARCLREACAAIIMSANQLLEQSQRLTTNTDVRNAAQNASDPQDPFFWNSDWESATSVYRQDSDRESLTPPSTSTWYNEAEPLPTDVSDWAVCDLDLSWRSDDRERSHRGRGAADDCVNYRFDMKVWSALENDKWPCFPG